MRVGVVGCGFVGLVTAACFAENGHDVVCIERDAARVDMIAAGKAPFFEPNLDDMLSTALGAGGLRITPDMGAVSNCEVIFLAVGTPTVDGTIDLSQLLSAARDLAQHISASARPVIVVKSTVVPGTTEGPVREAIETGRPGVSFALAMNPEFLREGSAVADFQDPDRIVLGTGDRDALTLLRALYAPYDCPVIETTAETAELSKYANNALLATLVSLMNDLATISEGLEGTDIEAVSDAVALDRRLSPLVDGTIIRPGILSYLRAGTGFGGSCLPKDVAALARLSHDMGRPSAMLDAVLTANSDRPKQLLALTRARLGTLNDRKISLLGLAFKPGTDDTRASVAFEIAEQLHAEGATVTAFDPLVKTLPPAFAVPIDLAPSAEAALEDADAALVVTAWPQFATLDWVTLPDRMRRPLVVDGRNFLRHHDLPQRIEYVPIGVNPADHSGQPDRHE